MCGIVGYIGGQAATPIILNGLRRLEYRGYDSAGLAVLQNGAITVRREAGKLERLQTLVRAQPLQGSTGIGHTRWATHGEPTQRNAHPHLGPRQRVVLVHNGIVENFLELRSALQAGGAQFQSETDSEVVVHLIEAQLAAGAALAAAMRSTMAQLRGANALVAMCADEPDKIVAVRMGNSGGIVLGLGEDEMFLASDIPAILEHTRQMIFLEPGCMAVLERTACTIFDSAGAVIHPPVHAITYDAAAAEKGNYAHFMQKEIHEQVRALTNTIIGRVDFTSGRVQLPELKLTAELARRAKRMVITGCGTAAHAGMVGKLMIESLARLPVEISIASEFRYADPIVDGDTIVLAISQSGETADTLAAIAEAAARGAVVWSIVNAIGSQAARVAHGHITMQSGPEIGVASTKAFTTPLVDLYMLAMLLGDLRGTLPAPQRLALAQDLARLPDLAGSVLDREPQVQVVAQALQHTSHCMYLGRGINMPIAYEGALKLKEISYIHAEGYPAGEMKHGPIALVEPGLPVVCIAVRDQWHEKMLSQVEQVRARGGMVVAVATDGDERMAQLADHVLWIPPVPWLLSPVLTVIPLQLLAYHVAVLRGCDVDQPRNLAKSVTVE